MDLTCTSFSFPRLAFEKSLQVIALLGIEAADLCAHMGNPNDLHGSEIEADTDGQIERVKRAVGAAGLAIADLYPTFGVGFRDRAVNTPDPATRAANRRTFAALVRLSKAVGCPGITILPGVIWEELGPDRSFDLAVEALTELVQEARSAGLRLSVEPHLESVVEPPERAVALAEAVPGLRFTLDYTHFIAAGLPPERVHPLIPHTGHFHARHGAPGQLQCPSSESTIDYRDIVGRLKAAGYPGYLCVEYTWQEWRGANRLDVLSESAILRDQLREYLAG